MKRRSDAGFTLLEVVAAIALLSALTVAVLPLLVDATRCGAMPVEAVDANELRAFTDDVLRDEKTLARVNSGSDVRFAWKDASTRPGVIAHRWAGATDVTSSLSHDWIEFRCGDVRVIRYVRLEPMRPPSSEDGPP